MCALHPFTQREADRERTPRRSVHAVHKNRAFSLQAILLSTKARLPVLTDLNAQNQTSGY
jgi:hypothetical protein